MWAVPGMDSKHGFLGLGRMYREPGTDPALAAGTQPGQVVCSHGAYILVWKTENAEMNLPKKGINDRGQRSLKCYWSVFIFIGYSKRE